MVHKPARSRSRRPVKLVKVRPFQASYYHSRAKDCVRLLKAALAQAREAGAPYTVERIQLALNSARGAVRNAGYRVTRAELLRTASRLRAGTDDDRA